MMENLYMSVPTIGAILGAPSKHLQLPTYLRKELNKTVTRRPPALILQTIQARAQGDEGRKRKQRKKEPPPIILDSCIDEPNRAGRCRMRNLDGTCYACPLSTCMLDSNFIDEDHELVVVELQAPLIEEVAWLEDDNVNLVQIRTGHDSFLYLPRITLRSYVFSKVSLQNRSRKLSTSVYKVCSPQDCGNLLVTLVPIKDLLDNISES